MMRIAVAGAGGLGYLIATQLARAEQAYNVVVLSRSVSMSIPLPIHAWSIQKANMQ